jgi:predicted flap endonuclease-1-like 5' DNA nuclease
MATNVTENLMSRLNPKWVERFNKVKGHAQKVALVRDYPIQSGEEEAIIQLLIDKLDPAMPSVTRVSQVREEIQRDESKGTAAEHRLDNPEGEAYWQERLDTAANLDEIDRKSEVTRRHAEIKKLFPELTLEAEATTAKVEKTPTITINPTTKEAKIAETPPANTTKLPSSQPATGTDDLKSVPGFGKKTADNFIERGIVCQKQLFDLTYSQALAIAKTALVLAKIKDKFKSES